MGYNQHQSFFLRERWLGKALRAIKSNPKFFFEAEAFEKLGLGKNMVQSLLHWTIAVNAATQVGSGKDRVLNLTKFGEWILLNDPALKYYDTIAMIHYNLVSEEEPSSTWYWLFNVFNETYLSKEKLFESLSTWVQERESRIVSNNSLSRDLDCLLRMYASNPEPDDPEEVIVSPFAKLELIKEDEGIWLKSELKVENVTTLFVKYALCKYSNENEIYVISLDDILNKEKLLGKAFNLNSSSIVKLLSELEDDSKYKVSFIRTNNLDYVRLPKIKLSKFLENHSY